MRLLLKQELNRQGETETMIKEGPLPEFSDHSYTIRQHNSAADLSFNKKLWNPGVLYITAWIEGTNNGGVICDYFNNFKLYAYKNRIGIMLADSTVLESAVLPANSGHLLVRLSAQGDLNIQFNHEPVLSKQLDKDLTKIKGGYVTCGKIQGEAYSGRLQSFQGTISDLRFTMNSLLSGPNAP